MTEKELRRLSKTELLELLAELTEENEKLREVQQERDLKIREAGSIAEAAIKVTDVFNAAQESAAIYLSNIAKLNEGAEETARQLLEKAQQECEEMKSRAKAEVDAQWALLKKQLDEYCAAQNGLKNSLKEILG